MPWDAIAPAGAAFALVALVVVFGAAHPTPPATPTRLTRAGAVRLLAYVALLGLGGYAVLLLVVVVFSVWLLGDSRALWSAAWSGPFLVAVATPVFVGLSWLEGRWRR